jgi:hypothetical protein
MVLNGAGQALISIFSSALLAEHTWWYQGQAVIKGAAGRTKNIEEYYNDVNKSWGIGSRIYFRFVRQVSKRDWSSSR